MVPVYGSYMGIRFCNSLRSTIYGAFFSHQGETPGLGAEIAKTDFSDQFNK